MPKRNAPDINGRHCLNLQAIIHTKIDFGEEYLIYIYIYILLHIVQLFEPFNVFYSIFDSIYDH